MARDGDVHVKLSGYSNISFGNYQTQSEEIGYIGEEQRSAYGTLQVFNIGAKKRFSLVSPPFSYADYKQRKNFLISVLGQPQEIYIDSEEGYVIAKITMTGQRILAHTDSNDKYIVNLSIEEV